MRTIEIVPAQSGWMVRSDAIGNPLFYSGGGSAEGAAVRLAHGLADAAQWARVKIYTRDGSLAREFVVPALRLVPSATQMKGG